MSKGQNQPDFRRSFHNTPTRTDQTQGREGQHLAHVALASFLCSRHATRTFIMNTQPSFTANGYNSSPKTFTAGASAKDPWCSRRFAFGFGRSGVEYSNCICSCVYYAPTTAHVRTHARVSYMGAYMPYLRIHTLVCVNASACVYAPTAASIRICANEAWGASTHLPAYTHPDATNVMSGSNSVLSC